MVLLGKSDLISYTAYHGSGSSKRLSRYVACSTLLVGRELRLVLDNLTLLPYSDAWIARAQSCLGEDTDYFCSVDYFSSDSDAADSIDGREDTVDKTTSLKIRQRITSDRGGEYMSEKHIDENVRLVDSYFSDHMMTRKDEPLQKATQSLKKLKLMPDTSMVPSAVLVSKSGTSKKKSKKNKPKNKKKGKGEEKSLAPMLLVTKSGAKKVRNVGISADGHDTAMQILKFRHIAEWIATTPNAVQLLGAFDKGEQIALMYAVWIHQNAAKMSNDDKETLLNAADAFHWRVEGKTKTYLMKCKRQLSRAIEVYKSTFPNRGKELMKTYLEVEYRRMCSAIKVLKDAKK